MVATSFRISSIFALALLTASTTSAMSLYAQSEKPGAQGDERATAGAVERGTQLDLMLAPGAEHRFRVRRNELPPTGKPAAPDAKDPGKDPKDPGKDPKAAAPAGKEQAIAFELALAVERSDGADKAKTLTVTLTAERSAPVVYEALVDQNGTIQRIQRKAEGEKKDAAGAPAQPALPEADVRSYLEFALGTGLHGRKLEKGTTYKIGAADAARAGVREAALPLDDPKKGSRLADVALQFQGVGAGTGGELARFGLVLPESPRGATSPAAGGGKEGASADEQKGTPAGDAAYSLEDGLLARLTYRPRPEATSAATEPAPVDWLEIERVVAD